MIVAVIVLLLTTWFYVGFSINERKKLKNDGYRAEAVFMQKKADALIAAKQKSTLSVALSIANDKNLLDDILHKSIDKDYYQDLISKFNENAIEKDIQIEILDENLTSIYGIKKAQISMEKKANNIFIKAIVPLFKDEKIVGVLEVVSDFNQIAKEMKVFDIDSMLIKEGIDNYFEMPYKINKGSIVTSYEIKDINGTLIAYYVMSKKIDKIANKNLDFFMFKWITFSVLGILIFAAIVGNIIYFRNKKQKRYYKNIIDSSSNIVMVVDKKSIIDVNKKFFKYFDKYTTLDEFKKENNSISDFFVYEEGCFFKDNDGLNWLDYLIKNPNDNQIKIRCNQKEYYFTVGVSLISEQDGHYSAIFSDITKEKVYQKELEYTNITDPLTKIRNRYYYNEQIKKEVSNANRYDYALSLVIFDVDYFKKINDGYGHDVGDKVLIEYTKLINSSLSKGDIFCRIGGEEFALILPHTDKLHAYQMAEKLRVVIEEHKEILPITMSFGVVEYDKEDNFEVTFKRADEALYEAKNSGRNMVIAR